MIIYIIVYFGVVFNLLFQAYKDSCMYAFQRKNYFMYIFSKYNHYLRKLFTVLFSKPFLKL